MISTFHGKLQANGQELGDIDRIKFRVTQKNKKWESWHCGIKPMIRVFPFDEKSVLHSAVPGLSIFSKFFWVILNYRYHIDYRIFCVYFCPLRIIIISCKSSFGSKKQNVKFICIIIHFHENCLTATFNGKVIVIIQYNLY